MQLYLVLLLATSFQGLVISYPINPSTNLNRLESRSPWSAADLARSQGPSTGAGRDAESRDGSSSGGSTGGGNGEGNGGGSSGGSRGRCGLPLHNALQFDPS
ncbi:hypothetical protein KEM48_009659 [Puccinia striiformis f. sp. tritici PST-130]|uniref:Uncharacterized protein n=1 Tax=Puccinia striiformis f. sp. tritici PST-78 TaxID=1165861 RepID=A0A0L0VTN9_9BASI|nr:hypothetical protein H4Q26_010009 [Puccinia striiformis f. sp. tritici PST-130]KAI9623042.1 hypothetical protein KEM48_009659 [Puccinia striiformis f. sp. tritici PST-130]KNF02649.1 hypothetical protein PSTG_04246 [Puccinia striiformis f. sp. tritici PST-78]